MSKHIPQVSIGMPVYNGEKFIREALDSLLAQTFTDFELIISDNASIDGTEAICREYAVRDARIRYERQASNLGATANFKFVLDEAIGTYFMWAANDDIWSKEWLEAMCRNIKKNDAGIYGYARFIKDNKEIRVCHPKFFKKGKYAKFFLSFNNKALFIYGVFKTDLLREGTKKMLGQNCLGFDHALLLGMLKYGDLSVVGGAFHSYRLHEAQISHVQAGFFEKFRNGIGLHLASEYRYSLLVTPGAHKLIIFCCIPIHYGLRAFRLAILAPLLRAVKSRWPK